MSVEVAANPIKGKLQGIIRGISITGLVLMLGGMGLVIFEVQTEFLHQRLGMVGHVLSITCGTALSVWGLKENVSTFWPRLEGRGYQFRIPSEGAAFIAIMIVLFIGSNLAHSNILMMVFCVMAGAFVVNGWQTFTMLRDSRMHRELPERVMAGETLTVPVTLENQNGWLSAWLMTLRDSIHHAGVRLNPEVLFVRVPPNGHRTGAYHFCPVSRGQYEFTHLNVTTRFPLGLVERGVGRDAKQTLLVYPRLGHLRSDWRRQMTHSMELVSNSRPNKGSFQDEMHQIREFRPGDDRRLVHWRTSARMNELMVCEYQECRDRDLLVVFDAWLPPRPTESRLQEFEQGVRFAATVCMNYLRSSRQSSLSVYLIGKEVFHWNGNVGAHHSDSLLDAFAVMAPDPQSTPDQVIAKLSSTKSGHHRTLLITLRPQEFQENRLWANLSTNFDLQIQGMQKEELAPIFKDSSDAVTVS